MSSTEGLSRRGFLRVSSVAVVAAGGLLAAGPLTAEASQDLWRWCARCQGLWFSGNGTRGSCPAGGPVNRHLPFSEQTGVTSGIYRIETTTDNDGPGTQRNWWYCYKCTGLFFAGGETLGRCPAGASHGLDTTRSGEYLLREI